MKKIIPFFVTAVLLCGTINAQDSTRRHHSHDSIPGSDSTRKKNWHKNKMPGDRQRKNWPDTMGRVDTLKRE